MTTGSSTCISIRYTDFSLLDGYGTVEEYAERAVKNNQQFLCVSDHGMMAAIPRQIRACSENKLTPLYACELYLQDKHNLLPHFAELSPEDKKEVRKAYHLLAVAYNNVGYSNLVRLSSWGWQNGLYYNKPRVNYEQLLKYKEGIIFTSCCYNSEIGQAFDRGLVVSQEAAEEAGFRQVEKYLGWFGSDFYLELMLLDFNKQKPYDAFIIKAHERYNIPLIVTGDVHYCNPEDSKYQRYMLMIQKKSTIQDIQMKLDSEDKQDLFELQDTNLWMKSESDLNAKYVEMYSDVIPPELFSQAKRNTRAICERAKGVVIDRSPKLPKLPDEEEDFKAKLYQGMKWRGVFHKKEYQKRMAEEYDLICRKGFASYFLIQKILCDEARRVCRPRLGWGSFDGNEAIGPGRGSAVGSLACYCLGITDVDPIYHKLLFSRFLSEARGGKQMKLRFSQSPLNMAAV